ncbi:putative transcriptional regulator [Candidatus Nitrososphaera evergladensis SR1]|uniref:Putative transcriptional regulator n=1 Tax=Candidatus Nitrososphaera evergladensis SR1 TaxID=1459636 RepID=A0A075MSF1_9ARCH|nr:putative transcriptional regulator [Candidatus Nitrososphaera evergladensis SR1]
MDIIQKDSLAHAEGDGVLKTTIMYNCYVSIPQLRKYMPLLQEHGLIEYSEKTRLYRTTEKGSLYRKAYDAVADALKPNNKRSRH